MDPSIAEELLDELLPSLEALEAHCEALAQLLKAKGIATDEQLAPYTEQAKNASSVRWRAARIRIERLLSTAMKAAEQAKEKVPDKAVEKPIEKAKDTGVETVQEKGSEKNSERAEKTSKHKGEDGTAIPQGDAEKKAESGEPGNKEEKEKEAA